MMELHDATVADMAGVYRVCLGVGDAGSDAANLYSDPDLLGHVYAGPYVVGEEGLARVAVDETGVCGYVLGALDTRMFESWCATHWWPHLRERYPLGHATGRDAHLVDLIHRPASPPDEIVENFPSHLHIDLLPRAQGQGLGRILIEGLLHRLEERGSRGVHLVVDPSNTPAISFYGRLGFMELSSSEGGITMGVEFDAA